MRALRSFVVALALVARPLYAQTPGQLVAADAMAFYKALDLEATGKYKEAIPLFRIALKTPAAVNALLGLERAYAELGWTDSLVAPLDTLIATYPKEETYRTVQLRMYQMAGRQMELRRSFEAWIRDAPSSVSPYREYARLLLQKNHSAAADSVLTRARLALGTTKDLQLELAQTRAAQGQWIESARAWRQALFTADYLTQAAAYALAPTPSSSRAQIREIFLAMPVEVGSRRALAELEMTWGSPADGWNALKDLPADSLSAEAWSEFAKRAEAEDRWSVARPALEAALRWKRTPELSVRAGTAAMNVGDATNALRLAPLTAANGDSMLIARSFLPLHARALAALGRPAEAERLVEKYDRLLSPAAKNNLTRTIAWGWVRTGDMSRARAALSATGVEGDSSDAAGWLALYEGNLKSARGLLRGGTENSPELASALGLIARLKVDSAPAIGKAFLALAKGDSVGAATQFAQAAEQTPPVRSLLLLLAAQVNLALKNDAQAIALWSRIVDKDGDTPEAPQAELEWARHLRAKGDVAGATAHLEHMILTYSSSALVPQARRELELTEESHSSDMRKFAMPFPTGRGRALVAAFVLAVAAQIAGAQRLLVPMDDGQQNHLKAYGLTYAAIKAGASAEWLLNYRGGSFLLADTPELRRQAGLSGITIEPIDGARLQQIRAEIATNNMEAVPLEKAPKVAVYTPPDALPWDDAVTLALKYAGIEYTAIYDDEVEKGDLSKYDWLHLHHEDFTGQLNKFYLSYRDAPWFIDLLQKNTSTAKRLGFNNMAGLKKDVANKIREFVERGGFIFAMCGATETLELAMAGMGVDIAQSFVDGTPMDPDADRKMDWKRTFAFKDAHLEQSPFVNAMSDIDGHQVNVPGRRQPLGTFTLFQFSAKLDPVNSMLVQNQRAVVNDFFGVTTSFNKAVLKPGVTVLANEEGAPWVKYVHGDYGKGTWTYYGGHDPEDPQHAIGNPPTDLSLFKSSPGYRLILNNVLFPAAKKKPLKT